MGATGSVIQSMNHDRVLEYAVENQVPKVVVDALTNNNEIDGKVLFDTFLTFSKGSMFKKLESDENTLATKLGFELDMKGQKLSWYLRWAIENCIPGYQLFMLKRAWCWSNSWDTLASEGWSFDQVQRSILQCHFHGGYSSSIEPESVRKWLLSTNETPGTGPSLEKAESTGSVAYRLIKPATESSKLTFRQAFISDNVCDKATHFVSHSWSYPFWSVLEALINHQLGYQRSWCFTSSMDDILRELDQLPQNKVNYYWFDLFNKNQHIVTSETTSLELAECIREPGKMVFVLHPSMQWAIKRIWCLYEVFICMRVEADLQVAFSFEMLDIFDRMQFKDGERKKKIPWNSFHRYKALPTVDASHADATVATDKEMILNQIKDTIGIDNMNALVTDKLMRIFEESTKELASDNCLPSTDEITPNEDDDFDIFCDDRNFLDT